MFCEVRSPSTVDLNPIAPSEPVKKKGSEPGNSSPAIKVSTYTTIPFTDDFRFENSILPKSILKTVRIPLRAFTANGSPLDLEHLQEIKFVFDQTDSGELIFDDIEFLGVDEADPY